MGQILSLIGVPGYLQFILSTIFPSLLLITQLYHICYVVNKQRDDTIHEMIRLHQKNYFESLEDVYKRLESLDNDKKNLLVTLEDQKRLSEETFKQEMAFVHDAMRQNEYQLRVANAALDKTTAKMNAAYDSFNENSRKVNNEIRNLVATDNILIEKVSRLQLASRGYVPASIKKACQPFNFTKRPTTQAATSKRKNSMLQAQVLELNAHVDRLNKMVYGQAPAVQQAPPSVGTSSSSVSVGASTSASIHVNVPSSSSTRSKFRKSIRRGYDRMVNMNKRDSLARMVFTLRNNLKPRQNQSSNNDISDASASNSNETTSASSASTTTVSTSTLESRIDSLHLAFNNQLKDIQTKIDQLASKIKKSKHPQDTTNAHPHAPGYINSSSGTNQQQHGDTASLDLQVAILRDQVTDFHKEFINMGKDCKKSMESLHNDVAAVSIKQKELDIENRSRWLAYDEFRHDTRDKLAEIFSRYEATTAFQMKKMADVTKYSEGNIQLLHDTTKRHQGSLASLANTLEQLKQEINEAIPSVKSKATTTTTGVVLHKTQQRDDQRLMVSSAAKFINHMEGALKSDKAILDHNSKKLRALQHKLESSREVKNLKVQRELVDREFDKTMQQITMIKKRIEPEFENPPPLHQNGESNTDVNQRRDQFLR
ncbi:uncharacterized protein ATC70_013474 [Mucor velutinosus]|uniref:Uncharacterized protein n=1 Tax=Mucor velutinosus TaxID=708070 RepID=A0AAN7HVN9_9FUNG|nr:hypothetical protein ATC70_013474 [Mucor velutinosus]